jgi:spore germination protein KB
MLETGKIDGRQATYLMINMIISEGILFVPASTFALVRQDAWMSNIVALSGGLLMAWMWVCISWRYPGKTLFEINQIVFGPVIGKIFGFCFCWGWLHVIATALREFVSLLVANFMPATPVIVLAVAAVALSSYMVYSGLECIGRMTQVFAILITASIFILFFLSIPKMEVNNLLPVYDAGLLPVIKGSFAPMFWFGHITTLSILVPFLNRPQDAMKIGVKSVLASFFVIELVAVGIIAIFGPDLASSYLAPVLNGARMVHIANFLERMELILVIVWISGGVLKVALFQWVPVLGLAQLLGLKSYRPLVVPAGIFIIALSIWLEPDVIHLFTFMSYVWGTAYGLGYVLVFPAFLLIVISLKGNKR